ncbi:MAG: zf-HC2 domain-containing protein [Gemmatimonadaceae bacterium]
MSKPMTCDELAERLAEYLEGDMDAATRGPIEAHAASCADCGELLADLRRNTAAAAALPMLAPSRDLWSGIASRIETPVVELKNARNMATAAPVWRSRVMIGVAAAALVAVTATITHQMTTRAIASRSIVATGVSSAPAAVVANDPGLVQVANAPQTQADFDTEIAGLRDILNKRRPQLDSATIGVVEHNLSVIDEAIAQCKGALSKDPASKFLIESLNDALETKVQLLRKVATLSSRS